MCFCCVVKSFGFLVVFSLTSTKVEETGGENETNKPSTRFDF